MLRSSFFDFNLVLSPDADPTWGFFKTDMGNFSLSGSPGEVILRKAMKPGSAGRQTNGTTKRGKLQGHPKPGRVAGRARIDPAIRLLDDAGATLSRADTGRKLRFTAQEIAKFRAEHRRPGA
ncbi:MAG: hypothetical protein CSA70_08255 [Rhodobacterales bacterium]|nr:MAG: hypothetical protein CSA70_08255 [Rhodobacterales bacterium]